MSRFIKIKILDQGNRLIREYLHQVRGECLHLEIMFCHEDSKYKNIFAYGNLYLSGSYRTSMNFTTQQECDNFQKTLLNWKKQQTEDAILLLKQGICISEENGHEGKDKDDFFHSFEAVALA